MIMSPLLPIVTVILAMILVQIQAESLSTSSVEKEEPDPALKEFSFDIGYGPEYFTAYIQPDMQSFTRGETQNTIKPAMKGHAVKFFNMSPDTVRLYWNPGGTQDPVPMAIIKPYGATGTASFPGHQFMIASIDDDNKEEKIPLITFNIADRIVFYYDPYYVEHDPKLTRARMAKLSLKEYEKFTGREYISRFPRQQPRHEMWRGDYFGQEHWVTTKETHFKEIPEAAKKNVDIYINRDLGDKPQLLSEYRTGDEYLNLTLKVISCAPRAFEIENFLSESEVNHILHLANITPMALSSTGSANDKLAAEVKSTTRTSRNTWIEREKDFVIDSVYRRAADVLRIDEKLLRHRDGTKQSIGEAMQLVHYDKEQQYTAHHDFGYAPIEDQFQTARFSTLLLYLNEGMTGGETEFPRWVNGYTSSGLRITPKRGKAALFYSILPDGNMDDLSQHSANPIIIGEKMLINLWVHDPFRKDS